MEKILIVGVGTNFIYAVNKKASNSNESLLFVGKGAMDRNGQLDL